MTARVRTALSLLLTFVICSPVVAGEAATPPTDSLVFPIAGSRETPPTLAGPFPLASLDPYGHTHESKTSDAAPAPDRRFAWQPLNWKVNTDLTTEVQNEEQVVVNPLNSDNLVAVWRDFKLGYRRVSVGYSFDGGITWNNMLLSEPTYPRHSDPGLTTDRLGGIYAVILSYTGDTSVPNGLFVFKSEDGGVTWNDPVAVVSGVPDVFEDKELIACDRTGGTYDGNLYVAWTRFGTETHIMNARSTDGGASFEKAVRVSSGYGVQWPCPVVGSDGTVYVAWVKYWPPEIRIDRSFDGGASFGTETTIAAPAAAQAELNGGILVFSYPAMDCDIYGGAHDGRLCVAYMDIGGGDEDIFLKHSDDGGYSWSSRIRVNDDAYGNGRDQFHPWTCVSADGVVNIVFYDRRNDPANLLMDVYIAQSFDGGVTFEPNVRVTTVSSNPTAGGPRAGLIGEYIGLAAASSQRVHPVWTDTREGNQDVYTSIVDTTFVSVPEATPVEAVRLSLPSPNPFETTAWFSYDARGEREIDVRIFDVAGRLVRELNEIPDAGGRGSFRWDGTDETGDRVASGVYLVEASAGAAADAVKAVLVR